MKMNYERFTVCSDESDMDTQVFKRRMIGKMTDARFGVIERFVRIYNEEHEAPYGVSPNGYAYRCGHEHDCCGCIINDSIEAEYYTDGVTIRIVKQYNL